MDSGGAEKGRRKARDVKRSITETGLDWSVSQERAREKDMMQRLSNACTGCLWCVCVCLCVWGLIINTGLALLLLRRLNEWYPWLLQTLTQHCAALLSTPRRRRIGFKSIFAGFPPPRPPCVSLWWTRRPGRSLARFNYFPLFFQYMCDSYDVCHSNIALLRLHTLLVQQ